jgi:hypothetical protein
MKDRSKVAAIAIIALTTVTVVAIVYEREIAAIAPFVSAIALILAYVGGKEISETVNGN